MGAEMRLMPNAKQVIDNAFTEAKELDHHYIGTEHILLGLIRDDNGLGGKVLRTLGASHNRARAELAAYNLSHHRHRHAELDQNENLLQSQSPNLRSFLYTLGNVLTRVSSRERMSFTEDDIRELDQHLKPG
jgi:ATP-dependent Clp protease ATP-binding subunit ClpC